MKKIVHVCLMLILCIIVSACRETPVGNGNGQESEVRIITDMAGRTVKIPKSVKKVYSTGQPGVVTIYTINPDLLLGWCIKPSEEEADFLDPKYLGLPVLGLMQGSNDTANREEIMKRSPDIILMMTYVDQDTATDADALQNLTGIPVVIADYALESIPDTYRFLGEVMSENERAEVLAGYSEEVIERAKIQEALISEEERINVYYAQGSKGLQTAPEGSSHSEVIDLVGGRNIVTLPAESDGRLTVNMEQVLLWNPDVVIASYSMGHNGVKGEAGVFNILSNGQETWKLVSAVQSNNVFKTPCYPYNWIDMPPASNRIIGILWMGNLLYPDYFDLDIREETRLFYSLFYNRNLTSDQMDLLLAEAVKIK